MAPKAQEKMRRKSVSSKSAEVVTIGELECCREFAERMQLKTLQIRSGRTGRGS